MEGRSKREQIYVFLQPIHFVVQKKLTQYCKAIIFHFLKLFSNEMSWFLLLLSSDAILINVWGAGEREMKPMWQNTNNLNLDECILGSITLFFQFFYVFNFSKRMYTGKLSEKPENLSLIIVYAFLFSYYYAISISRVFYKSCCKYKECPDKDLLYSTRNYT